MRAGNKRHALTHDAAMIRRADFRSSMLFPPAQSWPVARTLLMSRQLCSRFRDAIYAIILELPMAMMS